MISENTNEFNNDSKGLSLDDLIGLSHITFKIFSEIHNLEDNQENRNYFDAFQDRLLAEIDKKTIEANEFSGAESGC
jgi:hypothetical protein